MAITSCDIWSRFASEREAAPPLRFADGWHHLVYRNRACAPHSHRSIEIVYHAAGQGVSHLNARTALTFEERSVVINAPGEMHDQEMSADGQDRLIQLEAPKDSQLVPDTALKVPCVDDPILVEEICSLSEGQPRLGPREQAIFNFRATAVLLSLIHLACLRDDPQKVNSSERRVLAAEEYIRRHFSSIVSVREVADHVGIGYDLLRHTFKKLRKKSLVHFLNEVRVERAKTLLAHSKLSLKEIAPACGFNGEYYLSTVFRKISGTVPGQYRRKYR